LLRESNVTFDFTPSGSSVCNGIRHFGVGLLTTVSDGAVTSAKLGADSVNGTKIADDSISDEHLDITAITGQTAITSLADTDKFLVSDASDSGNLKYVEKQYLPSGGLVPITTVAFSSGTELVINNCFSATYLNYMMIISLLVPSSNASLNYRFNVGGTVDSTSNYRYTLEGYQNSGNGTSNYSNGATDEGRLFYDIDADSEAGASGVFYIHNPYGGYQRKQIHGNTILQKGTATNTSMYQVATDYHNSTTKNFTGINLFSSGATNWRAGSTSGGYGRVSIFGIVNS
jgi:hypothetical protein